MEQGATLQGGLGSRKRSLTPPEERAERSVSLCPKAVPLGFFLSPFGLDVSEAYPLSLARTPRGALV